MQTQTFYRQLQPEERMTIASMKQEGSSVRASARTLGRSAGTISRELCRNACAQSGYASSMAADSSRTWRIEARPRAALDPQGVLWGLVLTMLDWKWPLQQITGIFKRVWPQDSSMRASHETIYTAFYAQQRGELCQQLIAYLRRGRSTRMPRKRGVDRRGQIPEMVSIHVRPPEVNDRIMPGHREGDFIRGAGNKSSVGVLVDRSSRLVLLAKMDDATSASALAGFSAKLNSIAAPMRQCLTVEEGKNMSGHADLAAQTGVKVYFSDPHSPWQRGTCENTNGLVRRYLPKGTGLSLHTKEDLDVIADSFNNRPRGTHGFHSPQEVFGRMLKEIHQPSTSIH